MQRLTLFFALALAFVNAQFENLNDDTGFDAWKLSSGMVYSSDEETRYRKGIYQSNVKRINDHNKKADYYGWTAGINQFADLTADEWAALFTARGLLPEPPPSSPPPKPTVGEGGSGDGTDEATTGSSMYWGSGWEDAPLEKWKGARGSTPTPTPEPFPSPQPSPQPSPDASPATTSSASATPYPLPLSPSSTPSPMSSSTTTPFASSSSGPSSAESPSPPSSSSSSSSTSPIALPTSSSPSTQSPTASTSSLPVPSDSPSTSPAPSSSSSAPPSSSNTPAPSPASTGSVDWQLLGKMTPVRNQGSCGSCYSFATAAVVEGFTAIKTGNPPPSLSEQIIIDCTSNSGCGGGYITASLAFAASNGLCALASYPYTASKGTCGASSCTAIAKTAGYRNVAASQSALETAVHSTPVVVAVDAGDQVWQFYRSGVVTSGCGTALNHAVTLVGYGDDTSSGQSYYRIKNSWGSGWGENGYIRLGRGSQYGTNGVCGIQMSAAYPY